MQNEWQPRKCEPLTNGRCAFNRALNADSTHQKVISTAKRLCDEDEYDAEESLSYAVSKRRYLLSKKLNDYSHQAATLTEEGDEDGHVEDGHVNEAPMMHQRWTIINRRDTIECDTIDTCIH
jgi:hypothetical protein